MKNIKILKTGIDISKILAQLQQYPEDWEAQKNMDGQVESLLDRGYDDIPVGVLQLVMGGVNDPSEFVGDTEICIPTAAFEKHDEVINFLAESFGEVSRCGFLSIPIGGEVGLHIDEGKYYLTKDRYHLSIQGRYEYTVGDETVIVEPGTLLWFNNKLMHGAKNIGNCVRVTFVFDVPMTDSDI
jgi:mannose-6-phosphate isomerase-like protein (cupin superfamily)